LLIGRRFRRPFAFFGFVRARQRVSTLLMSERVLLSLFSRFSVLFAVIFLYYGRKLA
jgi:hypothetical protein